MVNAIESTQSGITYGLFGFGIVGDTPGAVPAEKIGSTKQKVHDGDTVNVRPSGNFGVRFQGIDAAEVSAQIKGSDAFPSTKGDVWKKYLTNPFSRDEGYESGFSPGLLNHLKTRFGEGAGQNHYRHAEKARAALIDLIEADMKELNQSKEEFQFFVYFVYEVMDRYGRLLGYINRNQPKEEGVKRPLSYNERLLEKSFVCPYFIWPSIDPFFKAPSIASAVPKPGEANIIANKYPKLKNARKWVKDARDYHHGIFDKEDPLVFEPFEVRYLGRKSTPGRWIIDLSKDDNVLVNPQEYYKINMEDRLFIDEEYLPLFVQKGWVKQ